MAQREQTAGTANPARTNKTTMETTTTLPTPSSLRTALPTRPMTQQQARRPKLPADAPSSKTGSPTRPRLPDSTMKADVERKSRVELSSYDAGQHVSSQSPSSSSSSSSSKQPSQRVGPAYLAVLCSALPPRLPCRVVSCRLSVSCRNLRVCPSVRLSVSSTKRGTRCPLLPPPCLSAHPTIRSLMLHLPYTPTPSFSRCLPSLASRRRRQSPKPPKPTPTQRKPKNRRKTHIHAHQYPYSPKASAIILHNPPIPQSPPTPILYLHSAIQTLHRHRLANAVHRSSDGLERVLLAGGDGGGGAREEGEEGEEGQCDEGERVAPRVSACCCAASAGCGSGGVRRGRGGRGEVVRVVVVAARRGGGGRGRRRHGNGWGWWCS
ncbi:hypothetical protein HDK77DRAFT_42764 [Phyllosticta capitalensis]